MGGEAKAYVAAARCCDGGVWANFVYWGRGSMVTKEEKEVAGIEGAVEEPNDSERFISGGERSEETEICLEDV